MVERNLIYDTFIKKTEILSKALEKATERTRTMLYVVTFFSLLIMVTAFNAYLSWDRKLNADERLLLAEEMGTIPSSAFKHFNRILATRLNECGVSISNTDIDNNSAKVIKSLQEKSKNNPCIDKVLEEYVDSLRIKGLVVNPSDYFRMFFERQKFTIPILGLSCYADDVYLIGGFGLLILLTYSFFSVRRENRIVQRMARSIEYVDEKEPKEYLDNHTYSANELALIKHNVMEYIFYGCVEFFIFNTGLSKTDITIGHGKKSNKKMDFTNTSGRLALSWLYYLPIFAMVFSLTFEVKSVIDRYNYLNATDFFELGIRYFLTFLFLTVIVLQCSWIKSLNRDNSVLIDAMYNRILNSRESLSLA